MQHERWVGALVNEQKGREKRESDSHTYITLQVQRLRRSMELSSCPRHIYSINIAKEKRFLRVLRARTDFRRDNKDEQSNCLLKIHLRSIMRIPKDTRKKMILLKYFKIVIRYKFKNDLDHQNNYIGCPKIGYYRISVFNGKNNFAIF